MDYYYGVEKSSKPIVFYHSKVLRKQDLKLKKKKTKIEWMKKCTTKKNKKINFYIIKKSIIILGTKMVFFKLKETIVKQTKLLRGLLKIFLMLMN